MYWQGCSATGTDSSRQFSVIDSSGVALVRNAGQATPDQWRLSVTPVLTIGGGSGAEEQLYRVTSATRLSSGDVVIANSGTKELLVFDHAGHLTGSRGGKGNGPGEYSGFSSVRVIPADGTTLLAVQSGFRTKLVRYEDSGAVTEVSSDVQSRGNTSAPVVNADGVVFYLNVPSSGPDPAGLGDALERRPGALIRFTFAGEGPDTVGRYPGDEVFAADIGPRMSFSGSTVSGPSVLWPFMPAASDLAGGGDPWRVIAGDQARPAFDVYSADGALKRRVTWSAEGRTIAEADRDIKKREIMLGPLGQMEPAAARRALKVIPEKEHAPVFDSLLVDKEGCYWVERYPLPTDHEAFWWVFSGGGRLIATVVVPPDLRLLEVGRDYVLALARDAVDVERVEMWSLDRDAAALPTNASAVDQPEAAHLAALNCAD